jgi:anhydro-N-acetylmuramic acid kinase
MERSSDGSRLALGLMSGTSMDGIDAAIIETDGETVVVSGPTASAPYDRVFRERLRGVLGGNGPVADVAREITLAHADLVASLLRDQGLDAGDIQVIGFHGHTILHRPRERRTWQIGDGALLAARTGIDVVADFRSADVAAGGEGAPFAPLYHMALCRDQELPVAVLNLGGVANVTWIGKGGPLAFDTGPGNALLDDWVLKRTGRPYDDGGRLAISGSADRALLGGLLSHPFFDRAPPKSLDRLDFDSAVLEPLSTADGAATLALFTCRAVALAVRHFPASPRRWLVAGGGRHNTALMAGLAIVLEEPVEPVETVGWNGDGLEAQAFAYLAVRSLRGLPLSLPQTTGVPEPVTGGTLHRAPGRSG